MRRLDLNLRLVLKAELMNPRDKLTVEASSSPIKRPSLILMAPIISLSSMLWATGIYMAGPPSIICCYCYFCYMCDLCSFVLKLFARRLRGQIVCISSQAILCCFVSMRLLIIFK